MRELINYLLQSGLFTTEQINLIESKITIKTLQAGDYFSGPEKPLNEIGFILKGILRVCDHDNKGTEITRYFIDENNFVVNLTAYTQQIPSSEYIQAAIKTELAVFSELALQTLSSAIIDWDKIIHQITARASNDRAERISPLVTESATIRYRNFVEKYSQIAGRVPLGHIASYLGITQQSFSRIRKQLTKKKDLTNNK